MKREGMQVCGSPSGGDDEFVLTSAAGGEPQ